MVCNEKKKGSVRFSLSLEGDAKQVALAGDFNDWKPAALRKRDGAYTATVQLRPGTYQYKFVVDGAWIVDPDNNQWALSAMGTINSVAVVA